MDSRSRGRGTVTAGRGKVGEGRTAPGQRKAAASRRGTADAAALRFPGADRGIGRGRADAGGPVLALRPYMPRKRRRAYERAERLTRAAGLTSRPSWSAVLWGWIGVKAEVSGGNPDADVMESGSEELARACAVMLQETWYEWLADCRQSRTDGTRRRRTRVA
jgi:hypothetical protein